MSAKPTDYLRGALLLTAAIAMIGAAALPRVMEFGVSVSERSDAVRTLLIPPGWAFSIWSVIFLGSILYSLLHFVPALTRTPLLRRTGWWAIALFLSTSAWQLWVPLYGIEAVSQVLITLCLIFSLMVLQRIHAEGTPGWVSTALVRAPLGLFAGWVSAATFVGSGAVVINEGLAELLAPMSVTYALVLLAVIGTLAGLVTWRFGGLFYALGAGWALSALMVRHLGAPEAQPVGIGAAIALAVVVIALIAFWSRRRAAARA